jgi:hypothetical protein
MPGIDPGRITGATKRLTTCLFAPQLDFPSILRQDAAHSFYESPRHFRGLLPNPTLVHPSSLGTRACRATERTTP